MIDLKFPDGNVKQFEKGVSGLEVAKSIAMSLEKAGAFIKLNGKLRDIYLPIEEGGDFEIITEKSPDFLDLLRHDTAHILADAIKELYPKAQIVIGPTIENGFYYDVARDTPFTSKERLE
jgi:threonyl-tRNA synthetase